jgi:hypothetical protein
MKWHEFTNGPAALEYFSDVARQIRAGDLDLGRKHYALSLSMGILSAIICNVGKITAIEFGVGGGRGLLDLCKAASFFRQELDIDIDVYGLDNATGLPDPKDYRDHPEIWQKGEYLMRDPAVLRSKLPGFARLVIGDVSETTAMFRDILSETNALGFVSIDVDFYSSAVACLDILTLDPSCYMAAVPMHFDDFMLGNLTSNSWCGERLAITEFNAAHEFRKIEEKRSFNYHGGGASFHACHILDSAYRTAAKTLRPGFSMMQLRAF